MASRALKNILLQKFCGLVSSPDFLEPVAACLCAHFKALFPPSDLTLGFCQLCCVAAVAELQLPRVLVFKLICGHCRFGF